ncbi:uncharacterized, partial [Tachysurus ichikawai]
SPKKNSKATAESSVESKSATATAHNLLIISSEFREEFSVQT